ncbi:hypothetical protein LX16_0863 [Stackebrandtia albiflava]|uniref:Uncharacterized protein n=1 Tax=Stackebrandtia albiflava TaxID=406432 RepID=A0A562VBB2_9ACTN|nr:hypothetical protein [Stackebrandtia albiflava]TWJ15164.1 hypothetical protein LX16_0863 [Stackebrandtia albiflava]
MQHGGITGVTLRAATAATLTGIIMASVIPGQSAAEEPAAGEKICDVAEQGLGELSGLAAVGDGYYAVGDGTVDSEQTDVYQLDAECNVTGVVTAFLNPADPEDLAVDADGMIWVADIGDNTGSRSTAAIHLFDTGGNGTTYRFTYPDGPHDAEAMLLPPDGVPIFVSKGLGESTFYRATAPLDPNNPDGGQLENIGSWSIDATETPGGPSELDGVPLGAAPSMLVTGGAVSPEGDRVVLRTYTDAYEWPVSDGDVAAALTGDTEPVVTPLPDEPQGEAITFDGDGGYVTASEGTTAADGTFTAAQMWRYQPATPGDAGDDAAQDEAAEEAPDKSFISSVIDTLGVDGILWVIAGVGVVGAAMFGYGLYVIIRARKRRKAGATEDPPTGGTGRPGYADEGPYDRGGPDDRGYRDDRGHHPSHDDDPRYDDRGYHDPRYDDRGHRDDPDPRYDDRDLPYHDDRRGGPPPHPRDAPPHHPGRNADDGLSGGRLFEPVRRHDDEFRDWPHRRPDADGDPYGGPGDYPPDDGRGTVYGGR